MGAPVELAATFGPRTHTYYRHLLRNLPPDVRVEPMPGEWGHPAAASGLGTKAFWKARAAWHLAGGVAADRFPEALVRGRPVVAAQTLLLNRVPWALDLDVVSALVNFRHARVYDPWNRALVRRAVESGRCRAVTYWSEIARSGTEAYLGSGEAARKGMLLYPAVAPPPPAPRASGDGTVEVLFVGKAFEIKGGFEVLEAAERLLARHPDGLRFTIVTNLPPGVAPPEDPRVRVLSRLPDEELAAAFARADVFLFPTQYEVFGVAVVEALANGLPVVALDEFALPEVVTHGEDGFLVPGYPARWHDETGRPVREWDALRGSRRPEERARVVRDLVDAVDALVRDPGLRARMGRAGRRKCEDGPFSVEAQRRAVRDLAARLAA